MRRRTDAGAKPAPLHDAMSFEQLERSYNHRRTTGWVEVFVRLVAEECARAPAARCLDIGCGEGIGGSHERLDPVRGAAAELWGVEPDAGVDVPAAFDVVRRSELEHAGLPVDYFDVAFSFMVMEHVRDPAAFLRAVHASLRPGGRYLLLTVNGRHYFGRAARAMRRARLDELAVRLVRGREAVEGYHYPIEYRCNDRAAIDRLAREAGFEPPSYVFLEEEGPIDYFRGPLRPVHRLLQWKRTWRRRPDALLTLIARLEKPRNAAW